MSSRLLTLPLLLLFALLVAACGTTTRSSYIKTRGFYVTYSVSVRPNEPTVVTATVQVVDDSGTYLELVEGDEVSCDGIPLTRDGSERNPTYATTLGAAQPSHLFVLRRAGESDHAATLTAPSPFRVTSAPLEATYDAQLTIKWSGAVPSAKVRVTATSQAASCPTVTIVKDAADTGSFAFDGSSLLPPDKSKPDCAYVVELVRQEESDAPDPSLAGVKLLKRAIDTTALHVLSGP